MDLTILGARLSRAVFAMRDQDIDAWIAPGRETAVLTEPAFLFLLPMEVIFPTTLILTKRGDKIIVVSRIEEEEMVASGLFTRVLGYSGAANYEGAIEEALRSVMPCHNIAINASENDPSADGLSLTAWRMLERVFQRVGFQGETVTASTIMRCVRGQKSADEAEGMARAAAGAMKIYESARPHMKVGMSGMDVQRLFQSLIDACGYGYSWQKRVNPFVSVGARSSYNCKTPPADVYIQPGDLVNVDLGIRLDGFASDNQRSFYALRPGETQPPEDVRRAFYTIQRMNREVAAAMRTGTNSDDLTPIGDRVMLEEGYQQGWKGSFGHELTLFAHNGGISAGYNPSKPELNKTLLEYMTFTLEPAIITSCGRLCQEEVVLVTKDGGKMLSTPQSEIWLIGG